MVIKSLSLNRTPSFYAKKKHLPPCKMSQDAAEQNVDFTLQHGRGNYCFAFVSAAARTWG